MTIKRQFGSAVAWMAFGNWTEQAVNFLVFVLLARILGAEAFGLLAMAAVFVILSEFLVRETFSEYLISADTLGPAHLNSAFWLLMVFGGVLTAVLWWAAGPVARFYDQPQVPELLRALSMTVPIIAITAVPVAILRRDMSFRVLSIRAIAGVIAGGVVGVALALSGAGVWALVGQRIVQVGVNAVLAWLAVDWHPMPAFDRAAARQIARLGTTVVALRGGEIALTQLPVLIIGAVLGPISAGFYAISWRLVELSTFLLAVPIRQAAQPAFAAMARDGQDAPEFLLDLLRFAGFVVFPAFAGMAVLSLPLLPLLFGEKWLDAAPMLAALAPLGAYLAVERQHQGYCLATGRAGAITLLTWIEAATVAALLSVFLSQGLPLAIGLMVLVLFALWPLRFAIVGRISGLGGWVIGQVHLAPLLSALVMGGGVYWLVVATPHWPSLWQLAAGTALGAIIYGALTFVAMRDRVKILRSFVAAFRGNAVREG